MSRGTGLPCREPSANSWKPNHLLRSNDHHYHSPVSKDSSSTLGPAFQLLFEELQ